jgi:hypothetical protein
MTKHCVASTCSTSEVPIPNARQAKAPCVLVWESPHTTVIPGSVAPCSGPITCTMPCRASRNGKYALAPCSLMFASSVSTCVREIGSRMPWSQCCVGVLWSAVAYDRIDSPGSAPGELEAFEGLRTGDFMHQVPVDVDQRRAFAVLAHEVARPELIVECLRVHQPIPGDMRNARF